MPLVPILNQVNPNSLPSSFSEINFNIILTICDKVFLVVCSIRFYTKILQAFFFSLMHAACPTHDILLDTHTHTGQNRKTMANFQGW